MTELDNLCWYPVDLKCKIGVVLPSALDKVE